MSGGRFRLGLGAGEQLNEHVTGAAFPSVTARHEMLAEAIEVMRSLWSGGFRSHDGFYHMVDDARIDDLPDDPIEIVIAVGGKEALDLASSVDAAGVMATDADESIVRGWADRGGDPSTTWTEVPFAHASSEELGLALAYERFRLSAGGWKVMSELPNPVDFDALSGMIHPDDLGVMIPHGPDPKPFAEAVRRYLDAGFDKDRDLAGGRRRAHARLLGAGGAAAARLSGVGPGPYRGPV